MPDVRTLSEQLWQGEIDTRSHHPVGGLQSDGEEIAPGVLFYKGIASANTLDAGAGLVMLDTGSRADTRPIYEAVRRWRPTAPLMAAVFSHHHVDHIFGGDPLRAGSGRPRLAATARLRARARSPQLRSLPEDARLEHRHQPAPVRAAARSLPLARSVPLP